MINNEQALKKLDELEGRLKLLFEERDYLKKENMALFAKLEERTNIIAFQDEEIEKLNSYMVIKNYTDMLVECNSLKAITELAVKELKLQFEAAKVWGMDGTTKSIQTTLNEIARMQIEQT